MTDTAPSPLPTVQKQLIVYDFDWSLADQDTDRWVHEVLAPDLRRNFDQPNGPQFTDLCAELLRQLHARGITQQQIEAALRSMYFVSLFVFVAAVNSSGLREMRVEAR